MRFSNKLAVVTGSAGGIGEGIATGLAREGAHVLVADLDLAGAERVAGELTSAGLFATAVQLDVASEESCQQAAEFAKREFGGIDYLVNNASIFGTLKYIPLMEVDFDYYTKVQSVNMNGMLLSTRAFAPLIQVRGGGAIVSTSSSAAWLAASGYYGVFKLAINGLTQSLALELGKDNIRVNAIAPGPTGTQAMLNTVESELIEGIIKQSALKRMGTVEDMSRACNFLLSEDAGWITGQILSVDGGFIMRP